jgi:cytochrome c oxidase subunit II
MVDPKTVLWGQTVAYTCYCLAIMAVVAWFAFKVTRKGNQKPFPSGLFWAFFGFLVILGVSLHIVTRETIPWKALDLERASIKADREFKITISNHEFHLPAAPMVIKKGELVRFIATSDDLTYGFGLFRPDSSMLFQMQVLPGHVNDILWRFDRPGRYALRSTEYSGWKGIRMTVPDAVEVVE